MTRDVTLVVTSCGRPDLLNRTLNSFFSFNRYPVQTILIEDGSANPPSIEIPNLTYFANGKRQGQVYSIDRAYQEVKTPYIFHCEDDWEFYKSGFIESSLDILEKYSDILQVWIRAHDDTNGHPLTKLPQFDVQTAVYGYAPEGEIWNGFSWNPGLRRLSDYQRLGNFSRFQSTDRKSGTTEVNISSAYKNLGLHAAILPDPEGYVRHIGWGRSLEKIGGGVG